MGGGKREHEIELQNKNLPHAIEMHEAQFANWFKDKVILDFDEQVEDELEDDENEGDEEDREVEEDDEDEVEDDDEDKKDY
ncbi:unnamed protein product [Citrullus colocynthis]|uniref:Uncharacterized protein n=1 Tax=Citrullus colocynthis TaxID=252529 RepID=A0ABP0ZCA9_9ROSI